VAGQPLLKARKAKCGFGELEVFLILDVRPDDEGVGPPFLAYRHLLPAGDVVLVVVQAGVEQGHVLAAKGLAM
jgi:hypothetical protein